MKKRIIACLTAVVLCLCLFAGCSQKTETESPVSEEDATEKNTAEQAEEPELTPVTLNEVAHSIFYAPMYVAIEEGYFEEEGIDLELVCGFGDNMLGIDALKKPRICVAKKHFHFWHFAQRFFVKLYNEMMQYSTPDSSREFKKFLLFLLTVGYQRVIIQSIHW